MRVMRVLKAILREIGIFFSPLTNLTKHLVTFLMLTGAVIWVIITAVVGILYIIAFNVADT